MHSSNDELARDGAIGKQAPTLAVITSVHGARDGSRLILDRKAFEGMESRAREWPGPVLWMLSMQATPPSYSAPFDPADLPFTVIEVAADRSDVVAKLPRDAIVEASADNFLDLHLARSLARRVIFIIEYTLRTRIDIMRVSDTPLHKKARRLLWELLWERRRKRAMKASGGVQCNGVPAYRSYAGIAPTALCYFDTRLTRAMQVDAATLAAKQAQIRRGEPLRLGYSGRIDHMKGAQFLLPLMRDLKQRDVSFRFDIFGDGPLAGELKAAASSDLSGCLTLHGPVSFTDALVPAMKARIDLFICPHPQGDPSCTYMETLGCGVPIVGFANEAWLAMVEGQGFGASVRMGDIDALADAIARLDRDREQLAAMVAEAATFSAIRTFEDVAAARLDYVSKIAETLRAS